MFGRRTRAAIGQWQAARGEEPTGFLDAAQARSLLAPGAEPGPVTAETTEPDTSAQDRQAALEAERERQRKQREAAAEAERERQRQQREAEAEAERERQRQQREAEGRGGA